MKKLFIFCIALFFFQIEKSFAVDDYYVDGKSGNVFKFQVYNKGETFVNSQNSPFTSTFSFTKAHINPLLNVSKTWADVFGVNISSPISYAVLSTDDYNAYSSTNYIYPFRSFSAPLVQKMLSDSVSFDYTPAYITIGRGFNGQRWDYGSDYLPLYQGNLPYLMPIISHELLHSFGIKSQNKEFLGSKLGYYFSKDANSDLYYWDSKLRIYSGSTSSFNAVSEIAPQKGMRIKYSQDQTGEFDISKYSPYFSGENVLKTLSGKTNNNIEQMKQFIYSKGGLKNYSIAYGSGYNTNRPIVYGVPVNPFDYLNSMPDLAHIELRNSFMSHQNYRNWHIPMEAEYSLLKDLGYDNIEERKYFGKSYYLNNQEEEFALGFSKWDSANKQYTVNPSDINNAIGLHIYGDNNKIKQTSDVLSVGEGVTGARIEGVNNTYTLKSGNKIDTEGNNSIGIGVSWGKNHVINVEQGASVSASGQNGIGASFDFGKNILGSLMQEKGSYSQSIQGEINFPDDETQGALVNDFNISGDIEGKKAAIYISDNAYVKNINVLDSANIKGDIISKWNSVSSGDYSKVWFKSKNDWFTFSPNNMKLLEESGYYTNLNFGTNENPYNGKYSYNINGNNGINNTIKMNVNSNSNLTLEGSNIAVYSLNNQGNVNIEKEVGISAQTGTIAGAGNINIEENGVLKLNESIKSVYNTVNINNGGMLSTSNNTVSTQVIDKVKSEEGAKLSFDVGDIITINDAANSKAEFSAVNVSISDLNEVLTKGTEYKKQLFGNKYIDMGESGFNLYGNGHKYRIGQDSTDKTKLATISALEVNNALELAAGDETTGNYIVFNNEIQKSKGGYVKGNTFQISGEDLNFNSNQGLIIDGEKNPNGTTVKVNTYNAAAKDEYKASYTVQNGGKLTIETDSKDVKISSTINDDIKRALYVDKTSQVKLNSLNNNKVIIDGKIEGEKGAIAVVQGDIAQLNELDSMIIDNYAMKTEVNAQAKSSEFRLNQGLMQFNKDYYLSSTNAIEMNGGSLSTQNNEANTISLSKMNVNQNSNIYVDMDLKNQNMDKFAFKDTNDLQVEDVVLNVAGINFANSTLPDKDGYSINFVSSELKNTNLLGKVKSESKQLTTPIYKYDIKYEEKDNEGNFTVTLPDNKDSYNSFNPSVMTSSIAAQAGGYFNQLVSYEKAFENMDAVMNMSSKDRLSVILRNRYANSDTLGYNPNQIAQMRGGVWFKPYTTFEKVNLDGGAKINNTGYGAYFGGDTNVTELSNGFYGMLSLYGGYTGSHQTFDGVSIYQNGGIGGLSAILYKKNFFLGLSANAGASTAMSEGMYGKEDFTMFNTGAALKTGYNFEFDEGRYIFQPSYMMSYSFINTFDYTNAAGIKIKTEPINALQIAPGAKFILNTDSGFQPYIGAQMMWNLMDKSKYRANDITLPSLSVKPYVQYGLGVQKQLGEVFTGYGQTMVRNGGRNGVVMSLGLKWALF